MSRRIYVVAAPALPLLALTGCAAAPEPDVIVRSVEVVCPSAPPARLHCPPAVEGETLGVTLETLRHQAQCLGERVEAWEEAWEVCAEDD